MGVPKFYRWLSERYACLSQVVKDYQIPEFDNLYLDMNGIIHPCSHPNDDDPHFRITEEQIFSNIFHYIEVLFRIVKPQKVFFMAIDGVAPRAKMNQQRSRRFRSAREAELNIKKALQKGETLPTEERFDSNCITPGTEFMVKLHEQLKYFVNKKISTDPGWQGLKIYLSGHETPGEGEHKIMDFIRYERSQPGYDPNTRHCLYGLDADLIMLGLTSHDPHFSLLREEVKFGKKDKRINNPENITFHLLHLSLLREYIDWEFESLKEISFGYDLEKIIDDWILMGFLVGNDFIPNLPNLHINHDALPSLWKVYKDIMPALDGYLHEGGTLNLHRFEIYITAFAKFDLDTFEDKYVDLKWLEGKMAKSDEEELSEMSEVDGGVQSKSGKKKGGKLLEYLQEKGELDDEEDDGDFSEEHEKYKLRYYREKFKLEDDDNCEDLVKKLCYKYVEAIQWILLYYFDGVSSWGWFYPFHYAPYVSDIKDFKDLPFSFNMGKPFLPFEQLLAVLPAASKKLLPEPFQSLMFMEHSPIIDYYPLEFETDLNGKKQDWEAVVLIPFIDEKRLLDAMEPLYPRLKESETDRNRHSSCLLYTHDPEKTERYPSSLPGVFPDLECSHASYEIVPIEKYRLAKDEIVKGLLPDVKLDVYFPGFPTLKHVPHSGELKKVGVKVFQMHSRGESMALKIDETDELNLKEIADSLLGKPCYVGWPHLVEAFVTSVSDCNKKYLLSKDSPSNVKEVTFTESDASAWKKQVSCEKQEYLERKAIEIGMTHILVEACQIQGKKYVCGGKGDVSLEKQWSDWAVAYPLQVTVKNISVCDETDAGAQCATVSDLFPVGTECFMMAIPHYGSSGKVIEVDPKTNRVRVQLTVLPEPDLMALIMDKDDYAENYIPAPIMAKRLGLTSQALAQITGKVFLATSDKENASKVNIGLNLKFSKQGKEVLGYARRNEEGWTYSPKTEQTISQYQEKFPQVFDVLSKSSTEVLKVTDVFPDNEKSKTLAEVQKWLQTLPSHKQKAVNCGSSTLDEPVVKQVEELVEKLKTEKGKRKNVKVRVKPTVLYRPMKHQGQVPADPEADFELFDRVVNVRTLGVAPYGLKGTIVGIHQGKSENDPVNYEVLFDEPFMGGESLRGSSAFENKLYAMPGWSLLNLSYGTRLEYKKKGLASPLVQAQRKRKQESGRSKNHNQGVPAEYKPSNRGGAYHRNFYSAWDSPPRHTDQQNARANNRSPNNNGRHSSPHHRSASPEFNSPAHRSPNNNGWHSSPHHRSASPEFNSPAHRSPNNNGWHSSPHHRFASPEFNSPGHRSPNNNGWHLSPRHRFASPEFNSSGQRPHFTPQWNTPRNNFGYRPLNPQVSPRNSSRSYRPPNSSRESGQDKSTSEQISAQETERVIRQLLHLDGSPGSNTNLNSPHSNAPDNAHAMPAMSPTSPISPSNSSGSLVIACHQNGWPEPTFTHHRIAQHLITTVCVAGKMFQGVPCASIELGVESAARNALMALFPGVLQNNSMFNPFAFSPPLNIPSFNPSPTQSSRHGNSPHHDNFPRHDSANKKDNTSKSSHGSYDRKSESNKATSSKENTSSTKAESSSRVQNQSLFIPLQVSLKKKEAVNNSPTKTSEDLGTQVLAETETHKTTNIQEPTKPESQEPTDNAHAMPAMSPTSPISPSNSSGSLVIACHQNGWPEPKFSHHRIAQHFITTVCVAGKMFQGVPCASIELAVESAARNALMALFPGVLQNNSMFNPFAFSPPLNIPSFNPSPTQSSRHGNSPHHGNFPRHDSANKKDNTSKSSHGSYDRKSESNKATSSKENASSTKAESSSRVQNQSLFVPLQVSLKKKEAVNNSPTKTSEDLGTQVLAETETHKTTNIQEPTKPESQEPTGSKEPVKIESQKPTKSESQQPTDSQEPTKPESQKPNGSLEPTKPESLEPTSSQEATKIESQQLTKPESQKPTDCQEPTKPQSQEPTGSQEPTKIESQNSKNTQDQTVPEIQESIPPKSQQPTSTQKPTQKSETQNQTHSRKSAMPDEKDTLKKDATTKANVNESSKSDKTSVKSNTGTKAKPKLLAPSFFAKKE